MAMNFKTIGLLAAGAIAWSTLRSYHRKHILNELRGKNVVITGGARGLGLAMVRECLKHGAKVHFCSRTAADIETAKSLLRQDYPDAVFEAVVCDVTVEPSVKAFLSPFTIENPLDALINNAGVIEVGPEAAMTAADYERSIATHFWGPYNTIETARPALKAAGGAIANIASIGGRISVPHLLPYSTGKFALVGYSEGLGHELAAEGISVTTVCPGLMRTGSARHAWFKGERASEHAWFAIAAAMPLLTISAEEAARRILIATLLREPICDVSWTTKLATTVQRLAPQVTHQILNVVNRLLPNHSLSTECRRGSQSESAWAPSPLTLLGDRAAERLNEKSS
jgi:NAD(P)-dependent dehydrogenase (short-subunit alcohol dehydrogenase family)